MVKAPKYKFLPEASIDISQTCPIEILEVDKEGDDYLTWFILMLPFF